MMLVFEASSDRPGLALLDGGALKAERAWDLDRSRSQQLFDELPGLLRDAGADYADLRLLVAGSGPGNYSGMRLAVTAARSMGLARGIPAYGLSSGEALAGQVLQEEPGCRRVLVAGDARRSQIWYACFTLEDGLPRAEADWALAPYAEADRLAAACDCAVSPDWERLQERVRDEAWKQGPVHPSAPWLGRLALEREARGRLEACACEPVYLHPPVAKSPE